MTLTATQRDLFQEIASRWTLNARPKQLPPQGAWRVWFIRCGRGWGKNRTGAEWILQRVREGFTRIALVGETKADVRDTMIEVGDSSILRCARPEERPLYEPSKRRLTFPNGAIAIAYSGDDPDQLRGPQHDSGWVDELAKFQYPKETWMNLLMGLRIGPNPQVLITTTPRPIQILKEIQADPGTVLVTGSTRENEENLSPEFIAEITRRYAGTRLGRQELEGEILDDNPLALWKRDVIENLRVREAPPRLVRIVVGVDPAVSGSEESDETGIVAAGLAADGAFYILADRSLRGSPNEWAHAVSKVYSDTRADRVIGEVNNGGDLVEVNLRMVDRQISYKAVHATRGKVIRAEPIAALYEQGKVHHVGTFPQLEDQMVEWVPGDRSPDRMDALVWALTELAEKAPITGNRFPISGATRKW